MHIYIGIEFVFGHLLGRGRLYSKPERNRYFGYQLAKGPRSPIVHLCDEDGLFCGVKVPKIETVPRGRPCTTCGQVMKSREREKKLLPGAKSFLYELLRLEFRYV